VEIGRHHTGLNPLFTAAGAILLAAAVLWISFRLYTGICLEDALITFRYARNLSAGAGFVFNPGERVLGTTTPLLTLLLGAMGAIFGTDRIPLICNILMMAAAAGAAWLTWDTWRRCALPALPGLFLLAALCSHPDIVWTICGGMETPLVLLLMAASLHALSRRAYSAAGLASGLLVLARIDGVAWALGVFLIILWEDRVGFARALRIATLAAAPWTLFAWWYFGSPIPHSIIAKQIIGNPYHLLSARDFAAFLQWTGPFVAASAPGFFWAGLIFFLAGLRACLRRESPRLLRLVACYPIAFLSFLYLGRSPLYFDWYLAPVAWAALLAGVLGVVDLAHSMEARLAPRPGAARLGRAAIAILLVGWFALSGRQLWLSAQLQRDYQANEEGTRRAIGEWLAANTPRDCLVAMEAIGYQGYYSGRQVIDLGGLVSPDVVAAQRESWSNGEAFHRIVSQRRPDFLVLRSFEVDQNLHFHGGPLFATVERIAWFAGQYKEVKRFEAPLPDLWGPTAYLTIYGRRAESR